MAICEIVLEDGARSIFTFGAILPRLSIEEIPRDSRNSLDTAEIAIGTSWIFSDLFWAVTTISPIPMSYAVLSCAKAGTAIRATPDASMVLKAKFMISLPLGDLSSDSRIIHAIKSALNMD